MPIEALDDQDQMPYGKHKGVKMENVPPKYLLWMWDEFLWQDNRDFQMPLILYIQNSWHVLLTECPDYIPIHPYKPNAS